MYDKNLADKVADKNNELDWDNCSYEWLFIRISGKSFKSWTTKIPINDSESEQEKILTDLRSKLVINSSTISMSIVPVPAFQKDEDQQKLMCLLCLFDEVFADIEDHTQLSVLSNRQFCGDSISTGKI